MAQPEPKKYDVIIIGGGGHGLSTAYYLSNVYGINNVAVLERMDWFSNIGRNTTIIRSNYMLPGNEPFYELSLKLWEGLEQDFNYNAMISQGIINLFHSDGQRDAYARRGNAMLLEGADAELLDEDSVRDICPFLDFNNTFSNKGWPHAKAWWNSSARCSCLGVCKRWTIRVLI